MGDGESERDHDLARLISVFDATLVAESTQLVWPAPSTPGAIHDIGFVEIVERLGEVSQVSDRDRDWLGSSLTSQ